MKKGELAFGSLADFIKHKAGVDIRTPEIMADRAKLANLKRLHRQQFNEQRSAKELIAEGKRPTEVRESRIQKASKIGQGIARASVFWEKLAAFKKDPHGRTAMESMSALLNASEVGIDLLPRQAKNIKEVFETLTQRKFTLGPHTGLRYAKFKLLGSVASGIDIVLGIQDLANAHGTGATVGYSLSLVGAVAGLVGAVASETGVGVIVGLAGFGLQIAGEWIVEHTEELSVYLRESPWGKASTVKSVNEISLSAAEIAKLSGDLDWVLFRYEWTPKFMPQGTNGPHYMFVEVKPSRGSLFLPPEASLEVDFMLALEGLPPQHYPVKRSVDGASLATSDSWLINAGIVNGPEAFNGLHLSGRLSLKLDTSGFRHLDAVVAWTNAPSPGSGGGHGDLTGGR